MPNTLNDVLFYQTAVDNMLAALFVCFYTHVSIQDKVVR